jgi:MOSC domain-containing protein
VRSWQRASFRFLVSSQALSPKHSRAQATIGYNRSRRDPLPTIRAREDHFMAMAIAAIFRYPVKGLSAERLERIALTAGECLPHDRRFALALPSTRFDPERPEWLAKTHFVMLMRDEKLAELHTRFDVASGELTIEHQGAVALRASLSDPDGRRAVSEFVADLLGPAIERPLRVAEAPRHAFADARRQPNATSDKYVSLINLASIAALEDVLRKPVDPLRFRANVYFAGVPPWRELDWVGREITLGAAQLKVVAPITRCAATQVNPATAARDLDIVGALRRGFGHNLMGIYAEVIAGGEIATSAELAVLPLAAVT